VLSEVIAAQHQANLATERLAEEYRNDPLLRHLPVPTISVGGTELTFHFAFANAQDAANDISEGAINPLEVIVDTQRLAAMPPECIQTITLKLSPQEIVKQASTSQHQ
jgi:hypothetical protein